MLKDFYYSETYEKAKENRINKSFEEEIILIKEILIKLKTEKLCPSHFGLIDYYGLECVDGDYIVDCNHCREMSIKNNINKECPEEGNEKIRCIDCSCNLCIHSCTECDIVDCEPKKIN